MPQTFRSRKSKKHDLNDSGVSSIPRLGMNREKELEGAEKFKPTYTAVRYNPISPSTTKNAYTKHTKFHIPLEDNSLTDFPIKKKDKKKQYLNFTGPLKLDDEEKESIAQTNKSILGS